MYILIREIELTKGRGATIIAELRRSFRRNGQARNEMVSYLGSIRENRVKYLAVRHYFWKQVDFKMRALGLPDGERERLAMKLEQKVPRP
jgi:hypothetical protein